MSIKATKREMSSSRWNINNIRERFDDKERILDRTLEQFAYAGVGNSRSDLCCRCFFHFDLGDKGWIDWACGYRGALLNSYRTAHSHAVRVASEKLS